MCMYIIISCVQLEYTCVCTVKSLHKASGTGEDGRDSQFEESQTWLHCWYLFLPNFWRALSNVVMRSALWGENRKGWVQVEAVWGCDGHGSGGNRQIKAFRRHRGRYAHDELRVLLNRGIQKPIASWGMELVQVRSLNRGILEQHRWKNTFFLDCLAQAQFHRNIRIC